MSVALFASCSGFWTAVLAAHDWAGVSWGGLEKEITSVGMDDGGPDFSRSLFFFPSLASAASSYSTQAGESEDQRRVCKPHTYPVQ